MPPDRRSVRPSFGTEKKRTDEMIKGRKASQIRSPRSPAALALFVPVINPKRTDRRTGSLNYFPSVPGAGVVPRQNLSGSCFHPF